MYLLFNFKQSFCRYRSQTDKLNQIDPDQTAKIRFFLSHRFGSMSLLTKLTNLVWISTKYDPTQTNVHPYKKIRNLSSWLDRWEKYLYLSLILSFLRIYRLEIFLAKWLNIFVIWPQMDWGLWLSFSLMAKPFWRPRCFITKELSIVFIKP